MSLCDTVKSLNVIKRLFEKYGVINVTEAFLFDVSINKGFMIIRLDFTDVLVVKFDLLYHQNR